MIKRVNRKMMYIIAFILCIVVVNVGSLVISNADENEMTVEYHACTVNGWNNWVTSGQECKVEGMDGITRIEMHLKTENGDSADSSIEYSVASDAGWSVPVNGGEMASAAGQAIKAMNIRIVGELANSYKVEYRACNTNGEWYAWENNGGVVGNINSDALLSAIEVKIVKIETATSEASGGEELLTNNDIDYRDNNTIQETISEATENEEELLTNNDIEYRNNNTTQGTTSEVSGEEEELLTNNDIEYRNYNTTQETTNEVSGEEELLTNNDIEYRNNNIPASDLEDDIIEYPPTKAPEYTDENMIPEGKSPGDVVIEIQTEESTNEATGQNDELLTNNDTTGETTGGVTEQEDELLPNNDINHRNNNTTEGTTEETGETSSGEEETGSAPVENNASPTAEALIAKAESQLGNGRDGNNETVYGIWWADRVGNTAFRDAAWCAMYLSWCANEAGVSEKTIGYFAACSYWQKSFTDNGKWEAKDGYTPVRGDIIFFDYDSNGEANHNGIVTKVTDKEVTAIEGNVNDKVAYVTYSLDDSTIIGYGKPDYDNNEANVEKEKEEQQQQEETGATNQAVAILNKAIGEIGYVQGYSQGYWAPTKYGEWFGDNIIISNDYNSAAWCAMFVSWCANEVGIPTDVIKPFALCTDGVNYFKSVGVWHDKSGYTPKPGDVIFFNFGGTRIDHTGLVEYVEDGYVHTVEGNTDDMVARRQYPINSGYIIGYGSPNYK